MLLVGDGSGSKWDLPCGWATVLIDRETGGRKTIFGANSLGSVNMAELLSYPLAMSWYHERFGQARLKRTSPLQVHVITDSQVTAQHGTRVASHSLPNVGHRPFWASMHELGRMGYQFTYHWAVRSESTLNWMADLVAGLARRELKLFGHAVDLGTEPLEHLAEKAMTIIKDLHFADPQNGELISVYNLNPGDNHAGTIR